MAIFKNKYELGKAEIGFIVFILIAAAVAGLAAWKIGQDKKDDINSFADCVAAGNPVMESYPEQCAANGQTFTNPEQIDQQLNSGSPSFDDRMTYETIPEAVVDYCSGQGDVNPDAVKAAVDTSTGTDKLVEDGDFARVNITCVEGEPELRVFLRKKDERWVVLSGTQKETIGCEELDNSGVPASIATTCLDESGEPREISAS